MNINPNDRYQTPTEVIRDLRMIVGERSTPSPATDAPSDVVQTASNPTILCVENRLKQQDSLREYFNKHGYRVLLLRDIQRAIKRIESDPPQGMVLMADALGDDDDAAAAYDKALESCSRSNTPLILVLAKKHHEILSRFEQTPLSRVLSEQPVTLRNIRTALEELRPKVI